ncbi:MAG: hypothetical protein HUJ84_04270 [Veillonella sp.]|nr:hypothetical protein [Veillonella sp.]
MTERKERIHENKLYKEVRKPIAMGSLTIKEIDDLIGQAVESFANGETYSAEEVRTYFKEKYGV